MEPEQQTVCWVQDWDPPKIDSMGLQFVPVEPLKLQQFTLPVLHAEPPPLVDYKVAVVGNAYTGQEQKLTMGLAIAKRGRARTIAFKESIIVLRMRWFSSE